MSVEIYIKELLLFHDCVIIPGLGGFIANYKSAEVNEMKKVISPPSKSILFNRNLSHNDGLLTGHISRKTGLGYKDAEKVVITYADKILKTTGSGAKFTIDELGFFYLDKHRKLQFQSELSTNFLLESYGLSDVYIRSMYQSAVRGSSRYISADISGANRRKKIRRLVYTGIAASLLAAMVLIPMKTGYFEYTGLRLFKETDEAGNEIPAKNEVTVQQTGVNQTSESEVIEFFPTEYHIITGSFKEFGNARMLMKRLIDQGYDARILSVESEYFRVSAVSFDNKQEASQTLVEFRKLPGMSSAWILKY
jgi:nucleoid DNA-binding protein